MMMSCQVQHLGSTHARTWRDSSKSDAPEHLLQVAHIQQARQREAGSAQSSRPQTSDTTADHPTASAGPLGNGVPAKDQHSGRSREGWSTAAAESSNGSHDVQHPQWQAPQEVCASAMWDAGRCQSQSRQSTWRKCLRTPSCGMIPSCQCPSRCALCTRQLTARL